ncbi:carboxypeptidase-like regulatory domain-containing protein [Beijerinckia sp. L45]|uniref:carboxypeptidase-like regulatory domain-containing protein n=1 Tax=Beijerinckia sp. L45 TaxID=1641855 RepID=UPI00131A9B4B|nr:carboxypeptidase-like regulatory domain-containing protein [Beijerinckia sp. L45]
MPSAKSDALVGGIHGSVVAALTSKFGTDDIGIPGAAVTLQQNDKAGGAGTPAGATNASGFFASPLQPAGSYRVCAKAPGFAEGCTAKPVTVAQGSVYVDPPLALQPLGSVLYGVVTLQSGDIAARSAGAVGTTASAATVVLKDASGHVVAGPVPVDSSGRYVLGGVSPGANLTLTAALGQASVSKTLTLSGADLNTGAANDLVLPSASPTVTGVTIAADGKPVTRVAPGSTVTVTVAATTPTPEPLHYRWITNSSGLAAEDKASVIWTLPTADVANVLFGEVSTERGGATRFSVTIPQSDRATDTPGSLTIVPSGRALLPRSDGSDRAASRLVVGETTTGPIGLIKNGAVSGSGPSNICIPCIFSTAYAPPPHQGDFIDPVAMMSNACTDETSCKAEATAYYKTIGALDSAGNPTSTLGTLKAWKQTFGFSADPTTPAAGEIHATYFNNADLQFGRDMHCRSATSISSTSIACYVSNYGDGTHTFGSDPQTAIARAIANAGRIATVAMTFSQSHLLLLGQPSPPPQVNFFVFNAGLSDVNDGALVTEAVLDSQGPKALPGLCISCHAGAYDGAAHNVKLANFLPFDSPSFIFSIANLNFLESSQREAVRSLNALVHSASPRPTIPQLIDGWYQWCGGVDKKKCYIDDIGHPYFPNAACKSGTAASDQSCGWPATWGGINAESFYQRVPRVYCRTCHVAQSTFLNVDSFIDWKNQEPFIKSYVLASQGTPSAANYMPFAEVPYKGFWFDFQAQTALSSFLATVGP